MYLLRRPAQKNRTNKLHRNWRGRGGAKKSPIAADVFPRGVGEEQKNRVGEPSRKNQRRRSKKIAPGEIASVASNYAIVDRAKKSAQALPVTPPCAKKEQKIAVSCAWEFTWGQQCDFFAQRSCASKIDATDRRKKIELAGRPEKLRDGGGAKKSPIASDMFPHGREPSKKIASARRAEKI